MQLQIVNKILEDTVPTGTLKNCGSYLEGSVKSCFSTQMAPQADPKTISLLYAPFKMKILPNLHQGKLSRHTTNKNNNGVEVPIPINFSSEG